MALHLSGLSFFGVGIAAVAVLLTGEASDLRTAATAFGVSLMLLFLVLEIRHIKPLQVWTSAVLFVLGLLAIGSVSGFNMTGAGLLYEGLARNLQSRRRSVAKTDAARCRSPGQRAVYLVP